MRKFFITGLPRSMTAWCSNFFSTGDVHCYHDGLANCDSLSAFGKKLNAHAVCGDADSGLAWFYDELCALYPDAQWAVIRRPAPEVVESLVAMPPYHGFPGIARREAESMVSELSPRLDRIAADARTLTLKTTDLLTREGAKALWWHCLRDGSPWNTARWDALRTMRVTVVPEGIRLSEQAAASLFAGKAA